jgi:hypothetical protein
MLQHLTATTLASFGECRFHNSQKRMTVNVLKGEVDQVCIRVNTNGVSERHEELPLTDQGLFLLSKNGDVPGFSRDIRQFQTGIEDEDIRVLPDRVCHHHPHVRQVHDRELVILFSSNKRKSLRHVEPDTRADVQYRSPDNDQ